MGTSFVGRDRELAVLEECLASAGVGRPGLVLCRGQPGIGKTRLVEELELASEARSTGAVVVWGRAPEAAGAPPYWPGGRFCAPSPRTSTCPPWRGITG